MQCGLYLCVAMVKIKTTLGGILRLVNIIKYQVLAFGLVAFLLQSIAFAYTPVFSKLSLVAAFETSTQTDNNAQDELEFEVEIPLAEEESPTEDVSTDDGDALLHGRLTLKQPEVSGQIRLSTTVLALSDFRLLLRPPQKA